MFCRRNSLVKYIFTQRAVVKCWNSQSVTASSYHRQLPGLAVQVSTTPWEQCIEIQSERFVTMPRLDVSFVARDESRLESRNAGSSYSENCAGNTQGGARSGRRGRHGSPIPRLGMHVISCPLLPCFIHERVPRARYGEY